MTVLMLLFWLLVGGTLQVLVPAWRHMGQPMFPFLLGVVLYTALNKKPRYFMAAAILAGILEDSLSLAPLGSSACAFLAAGSLAILLRVDFYTDKVRTTMCFGALCAATTTGTMALLLRSKQLILFSGNDIAWRMAGSTMLGAVLIPVWFWGMRSSERLLGTWEDRD
ncbi:MAG: rod shape-determining protein MreD [Verrucomicrobiota bacterium]|jgi:rod shape-determining protein MreD|nr:rod shape-determining protein MreD [Verrucomicrobiota bacterium]